MVKTLVEHLRTKGFTSIKADIPDFVQPAKITWKATGKGHIPDVSALLSGVEHIFEVEEADGLRLQHTADQFKLFGAYARQMNARFVVLVPGTTREAAQIVLRSAGATAEIWTI
jgi:hypothetical protein